MKKGFRYGYKRLIGNRSFVEQVETTKRSKEIFTFVGMFLVLAVAAIDFYLLYMLLYIIF